MRNFFFAVLSLLLLSSAESYAQTKNDKGQNNNTLTDFFIEMVGVNQSDFPCLSCSENLSFADYVAQVQTWIANNSSSYFTLLTTTPQEDKLNSFDFKNFDAEKYGRIKSALETWSSLISMQKNLNQNFAIINELKTKYFGTNEGRIFLFLIHQNDLNTYFKNI